ncbi:MAG: disulfide bond formation protein DsbD, partial [Proteobacteria bacterium]|nr:disulfide bond formation protein DsbD [Pseudomonadota bacterium]
MPANPYITLLIMISSTLIKTAGLALTLAVAVFAAGADAQTPGGQTPGGPAASAWAETEQTALRLIAATETTGGAKTLRFGLHFKMKPGWKVYWRSPGDAGFPPIPDWSQSRNLKSAVLHWPAPGRFSVLGLETLGYEDEVVLPMTVEVSDPGRPLGMAGTVKYLACKDICIPYEARVAMELPPGAVKPSPFAHLIDRFQAAVPGDGSRHGLAIETAETWTQGEDTWLRVRVTAAQPFEAPDLYPEGPPELTFAKPVVRLGGGDRWAVLDIKVFGLKDLEEPPPGTLAGRVLTLTLMDGKRSAEKRLMVVTAVGPRGGGTSLSMAMILVFAVLGGLILNLMPCVLPVLSIKLLGVVGHGGGESRLVRLSFVASAAGIVFAFAVMAAALVALKAAGMTIGWGIQFQQPWFLIAMTLVVTAFACNLWGFFEVRLPAWVSDWGEHTSHVHGLGGHFLQGVLATLLATPCSAPFLGTAVGFALARGWLEIALVFTALGLGLALPYLTVAAFPGLATRLPK